MRRLHLKRHIHTGRPATDFILKGFESGALKPIIDRVFSFDQIVEAHRYMEANGQFGKIVATV